MRQIIKITFVNLLLFHEPRKGEKLFIDGHYCLVKNINLENKSIVVQKGDGRTKSDVPIELALKNRVSF